MGRVRLESLQLTGFKSFPDAVELSFPSEVSAIIGPNGCGKSNVVDAILWVLGEQSPSLMRLKNMGDVVFSGAASRPAAGAAEVGLVLTSDDGRWESSGGHLEITRRVYSTGPSEYRLNGKTARLKDVVDELLSVGLGTRDYSIIEQGRVGQVLSARPTDRRVLIEEAAGITRYKVRRHEAGRTRRAEASATRSSPPWTRGAARCGSSRPTVSRSSVPRPGDGAARARTRSPRRPPRSAAPRPT